VKTVAFEDTAALIGILVAAGGITLHAVTGSGVWDGAASILIGVLLIGVAISLGSSSKRNLIGEAVPENIRNDLTRVINESVGVDVVVELMTMRLGPDDVLVAARVDVDDTATGGDLERVADEVERRIKASHPEVRHVFLDPTAATTVSSDGPA
jgi:divalent metal cation (Fe/Co/Zn/Cd) transporter